MKGTEEGCFRTLLVHSAATDANPAQPFLVHDPRFERWRRPFWRVKLFHVVHKIDADGGCRTCIQSAEDPRLARCWHNFNVRESCIASELCHIVRALRIVAVLGRDRGQSDPVLQPLHVLVMHRRYLAQHRLEVRIVRGESRDWQGGKGGSSKCAVDELSTIERVIARVSQCVPHCPKNDYPWLVSDSILEREPSTLYRRSSYQLVPYRPAIFSNGGGEITPGLSATRK